MANKTVTNSKVIIIIIHCCARNINRYKMYFNNITKIKKGIGLYRNIYYFAKATITKYQRVSGFNNGNLFSHCWEG